MMVVHRVNVVRGVEVRGGCVLTCSTAARSLTRSVSCLVSVARSVSCLVSRALSSVETCSRSPESSALLALAWRARPCSTFAASRTPSLSLGTAIDEPVVMLSEFKR